MARIRFVMAVAASLFGGFRGGFAGFTHSSSSGKRDYRPQFRKCNSGLVATRLGLALASSLGLAWVLRLGPTWLAVAMVPLASLSLRVVANSKSGAQLF